MTLEEIKQLIDLANESGVAELEVERGGNRVRIRRAAGASPQDVVLPPPAPTPAAAPPPVPAPQAPAPAPPGEDPSLVYVKAPIVGTFYTSPSPDAPPFVQVGDRVQPGQVLCIIESMKLMNEIECETAGVIVQRFLDNSQPAEYGQTLFAIRPS
jgi:acetyl-CoA carboxylase biotin carboxyl carrier protein